MRTISVSRAALVLLALGSLGAAGPSTCFEAARPLSPADPAPELSFNFKKSLATLPDGSVHAVWHAGREGAWQVFYRRSPDGGAHWEPPRALSPPLPLPGHPALAAAGGAVQVAWQAARPGGVDVVLRRSPDAGGHFEPARRISVSGAGSQPSLAAFGPFVHVVWGDARSGVAEIYVRSSRDLGASFAAEQRLSEALHESWVPSADAWGEIAVVAWVDYRDANEEEYVRVSRDAGRSWEPARRVTDDPADSWAPSVAVRGSAIFLTWFDRRPAGILETDVEAGIDAVLELLGLPVEPAPPRDPAVYYLPGFRERLQAKTAAVEAAAPGWVADGGDPALLEAGRRRVEQRLETWSRGWGIFLSRSPDLGASWEPARLISQPGGPAIRPSLDVAGPDLHVAWFDGRHGPMQVYYRHSPDLGSHFGPEQRLTRTPASSLRPSLAAEGPRVHVLWLEEGEGERRVFTKRGFVGPRPSPG